MNDLEILDPTAGEAAPAWKLAPRHVGPAHVGFLDISKPQGDIFLDELERLLVERSHAVSRFRKPTMARPATPELIREMASTCDAAVVALAD
jgi:hypothetical protein